MTNTSENCTLKKSARMREPKLIAKVRHEGQKRSFYPFLVFRLRTGGSPRLAIAITKNSGNSVVRNRSRRKVREFFRTHKNKLGEFDYFFYTSANLSQMTQEKWEGFFSQLKKWGLK